MSKIYREQYEVPSEAVIEVMELLLENEISFSVEEADSENDNLTIEVDYEKDDREAINEMKEKIEEYE
jgi:hypothetical protein